MQASILGSWSGTLRGSGVSIRILVAFDQDEGMVRGTLVSPDQSTQRLPLSQIHLTSDALSFVVAGGRGAFSGEFSGARKDGLPGKIDGVWSQGRFRGELQLTRSALTLEQLMPGDCLANGKGGAERLAGTWHATLKGSAGTLPLALIVAPCDSEPTRLQARVVSQSQAASIPVTEAYVSRSGAVVLSLASIGARFEGELQNADMTGTWTQGASALPLRWKRAPRSRPQELAAREGATYDATEVRFASADGQTILAGTLSTPRSPAHGGLILVTGSGPQDRDESIAGHKPFLVLADHIARAGYTVLRYDDRGIGDSGGDFTSSTIEQHLADLRGAIRWLRQQTDVPIGVLGHSLGGNLAAQAAADGEAVAFLVLLATPSVPGRDLMLAQTEDVAASNPATAAAAPALRDLNQQLYDIATGEGSEGARRERIGALLSTAAQSADPPLEQYLPEAPDALIDRLLSPRFQFILRQQPAQVLAQLRIPVLAVYGGKDVQVREGLNRPAMEVALAKAPGLSAVRTLPGLNHLMQSAGSGHPSEYATLEETVSPTLLHEITRWLEAVTGPAATRRRAP
jgi:pimeloyl-ACP methyl ester carboxylesterase